MRHTALQRANNHALSASQVNALSRATHQSLRPVLKVDFSLTPTFFKETGKLKLLAQSQSEARTSSKWVKKLACTINIK